MFRNLNLSHLNFENVGAWPYSIKVVACCLLGSVLIIAGYFFDSSDQLVVLNKYKQNETQLRASFELKQRQTASFAQYKKQLVAMRQLLGAMLRELPSRAEVPGLLEDISKSGRTSGLEFKLFDPLDEVKHDFYAELPIQVTVEGDYQQLGDFVSRIADLKRIVTLHDLVISPAEKADDAGKIVKKDDKNLSGGHQLVMTMTAKTYRYAEDEKENGQSNTQSSSKAKR